jgi:hypothetical protein
MELRYRVASAVLGLSLALAPSAARAQGVVRLGMVGGMLHRNFGPAVSRYLPASD